MMIGKLNISAAVKQAEALLILGFFVAVFVTSLFEKENRAATLAIVSGILLSAPFFVFRQYAISGPFWLSALIESIPPVILLAVLLPFRGRTGYIPGNPVRRYDERDTMFSRAELEPGTERYENYYRRRPGNKTADDAWRRLPGLLRAGSRYYDPILFAAANSIFDRVVEDLHPRVEGEISKGTGSNPAGHTKRLLRMARDWGAASAGIAELKDYHYYSVGGRGDRYDREFEPEHKYAIAITVEMDYDMMRAAPAAPTVLESANRYLQSGMIAVQIAEYIRSIGYPARAHIDGNYKLICPLVARDAGLGEIGRMGLLMTPRLGPRCRIALISTDLPLQPSEVRSDPSVIDFCRRCEKCAEVCPGRAIPPGLENETDGALRRWKTDDLSCYSYWCKAGTDCGRCMIVCPFSHPDNWFHRLVRFGIRNNLIFRRIALPFDHLFYGRKPRSRAVA